MEQRRSTCQRARWRIYIYIYIYDSLHLIPDPELQARLLYSPRNPKTSTVTQIVHFPFGRVLEASGREPEAYRKFTGRLTFSFLFYCCSGSSWKLPGRLTRSLLGSCCFTWVPEGFRKTVLRQNEHLIFQASQCKQSDWGQLPWAFSRAGFMILAIPLETCRFLNTSLYETD